MKNYMRYETGVKAGKKPLSVKKSSTITKMTTGEIAWHVYKRHEILILNVITAAVITWALITKG